MGKLIDLTGRRFGRLVVLKQDATIRYTYGKRIATVPTWLCQCDCGTQKTIRGGELRSGETQSCGCLEAESRRTARTHGMSHSAEYGIWAGMIQRCSNSQRDHFHNYGGRGILVCERWLDFGNFFADMGPRPGPLYSLDRIDLHGDYEPDNCRWATMSEQMHNTTRSRHVEYGGQVYTVAELARKTGVNRRTLYGRLDRGVPVEEAVIPSDIRRRT